MDILWMEAVDQERMRSTFYLIHCSNHVTGVKVELCNNVAQF